jgi:hypothetical protein
MQIYSLIITKMDLYEISSFLELLRLAIQKTINILLHNIDDVHERIIFMRYMQEMTDYKYDFIDIDYVDSDYVKIAYCITDDVHKQRCFTKYSDPNNDMLHRYVNLVFPSITINGFYNKPYPIMLPFLQSRYNNQYVVDLICEQYSGDKNDLTEFRKLNEIPIDTIIYNCNNDNKDLNEFIDTPQFHFYD